MPIRPLGLSHHFRPFGSLQIACCSKVSFYWLLLMDWAGQNPACHRRLSPVYASIGAWTHTGKPPSGSLQRLHGQPAGEHSPEGFRRPQSEDSSGRRPREPWWPLCRARHSPGGHSASRLHCSEKVFVGGGDVGWGESGRGHQVPSLTNGAVSEAPGPRSQGRGQWQGPMLRLCRWEDPWSPGSHTMQGLWKYAGVPW